MRNFKKFLTLALAVLMIASTFAFGTSAAKFTDVDENNEYLTKAVNLLSYLNVTKGTTETTFGTDELVTREQMAAFIYRFMMKGKSVENGANTSTFTDLEDPTFFFMISWANNSGIIKGTSASTFNPKGSITLQDAYAMIVRALGYEEESSLPYPFGYITVAEGKGVELNEGLASTVGYEDALTRGDVAILLYNAFFAETGVAETEQVPTKLGSGEEATWVLKTETTYPTFCEKYFDVEEVIYQAVATTNYTTVNYEITKDLFDYEAVLFAEAADEPVPEGIDTVEFYADVADLAIDGSADDYILSYFKMYVTIDEDDEVDEILYAEPLMTKKTVNELKFETVSSNKADSYFENGAGDRAAKYLSGKVIADGEAIYFFNAPYAYARPTYTDSADDILKYRDRNEENMGFISYAFANNDEDDGIEVSTTNFAWSDVDADGKVDYDTDSTALIEALTLAYTGGAFEAEIMDINGDGIYDYMNYMPYEFAVVDTDKKKDFADDGIKPATAESAPVLYTNKANVDEDSAKFEDEDFVIGYFNKNINYIKVAEVIKPVVGAVNDITKSTKTIELSNGAKVSVADAWKYVTNYSSLPLLADAGYDLADVDFDEFDDELLGAGAYEAEEAEYYIYKDTVLYFTGVESSTAYDGTLLVITEDDEEGNTYDWIHEEFTVTTGKTETYLHVYVDGEARYVPVDTEGFYPEIEAANEAYYLGKIASYSVDEDGIYTIKLLDNAYDHEDMAAEDYVGLEKDLDVVYATEEGEVTYGIANIPEADLVKDLAKRFILENEGANLLGDKKLYLDEKTVILVKNYDSDAEEYKFETYALSDLSNGLEGLTNVQMIVTNDDDHSKAYKLVTLYAEATNLEPAEGESKKADRIVKLYDVVKLDGKYVTKYSLLNPYTGAVDTAYGTYTAEKASTVATKSHTNGKIVEVTASGKVDESNGSKDIYFPDETDNLYWIISYDAEEEILEVAEYDGSHAIGEAKYIDARKAAVSKLSHSSEKSVYETIKWGNFGVLDIAELAKEDNESTKMFVTDYIPGEGEDYETVYTKYALAYIEFTDEDMPTATKDEDGFHGEADYIIVEALRFNTTPKFNPGNDAETALKDLFDID